MHKQTARVLVIDDNEVMREGMAIAINRLGHEVAVCSGGAQGIEVFEKSRGHFNLVITDLKMSPVDGLEVVRRIREIDNDALVMVVTAWGSIESAVEAMRVGAFDFVTKPFTPEVLRLKVEKALALEGIQHEATRWKARAEALEQDARENGKLADLIGSSESMRKTLAAIRKVASTDATVLITGESGTGKELVARAIHDLSDRQNGPFVVVHCAALPETLLESELFGHEKGAFTGAVKRKLGRFELADQGTLFLDEVGEISLPMQTKLLRVLQEREIQRLGSERTLRVDTRVVSATNRDLRAAVEKGLFREDLYYRLHIVPINVPPLRERRSDIGELVSHFLQKHRPRLKHQVKGITEEAKRVLQAYYWPGNVRELENAVSQAIVFCEEDMITISDLPAFVTQKKSDRLSLPESELSLPEILEDLEKQLILRALEKAQGVKTEAARQLGIKTSGLYYKLEKYGLLTCSEMASAREKNWEEK